MRSICQNQISGIVCYCMLCNRFLFKLGFNICSVTIDPGSEVVAGWAYQLIWALLTLLLVDYIFGVASVVTLYLASLVCVGVGQIFTRPISFLSFEFFELTGKKALW